MLEKHWNFVGLSPRRCNDTSCGNYHCDGNHPVKSTCRDLNCVRSNCSGGHYPIGCLDKYCLRPTCMGGHSPL